MKIIFTVTTPDTTETVDAELEMLAKFSGWQKEISTDNPDVPELNPVTPKEYVGNMISDFLKEHLREAYKKQAQIDAINEANKEVDAKLKEYTSTLEVE